MARVSSAANRVHYSGLGCGGHWTYLGTAGATVRFREVIDSGKSSTCKGVGEVTLSREGARLRYRFSGDGVVSGAQVLHELDHFLLSLGIGQQRRDHALTRLEAPLQAGGNGLQRGRALRQ